MQSWIQYSDNCDFSIHNIPFGVGQFSETQTVAVTAIGDFGVKLNELQNEHLFDDLKLPKGIFEKNTLNEFITLGKLTTNAVRLRLQEAFTLGSIHEPIVRKCMYNRAGTAMLVPVNIPNYTDFYSSIDHATNVGSMFRDPANALLPNWKHIPIGYHGRASSIKQSGIKFLRPDGQSKAADAELPTFGPTKMLDFELEMAFIVGKQTEMGETISTSQTDEYIFGFVLFNDWSARDFQTWEYVPLGPFLSKSFCSVISPWIVTLEALEPFRVQGQEQIPKPLPYLQFSGMQNLDINLEVCIETATLPEMIISKSNYKYLYWNMSQQIIHQASNGCNLQVGDMYASGTISGPTPDSFGSMLELTWRGTKPIRLNDGTERKFIQDSDTIILRGYAAKDGIRVGFGECRSGVLGKP